MAYIFIMHYLFYFILLSDCTAVNETRRNVTGSEAALSPAACKTECQMESDGHTQKCTTKCQMSMPFQVIGHHQQQQIQFPTTQIFTKMSETREFMQQEDCVKFCQEKGMAKSAEECRGKCPSVPASASVFNSAVTAIPQLTLNVPLVIKTSETHEFVG
uniref:Transmembrane protein n=1 Tax=Globodera pallida TaxID=36090 RepID=A0A183C1Q6_GLOPA